MEQLFNRRFVIQGLFILLALVLIGKLFYMQVVSDKYFLSANSNALRKQYVFPARGAIFDRNRIVLVQNQPTYDLLVTPKEIKDLGIHSYIVKAELTPRQVVQRVKEALGV